MKSLFSHLECAKCGRTYRRDDPRSLCDCGCSLLARYSLTRRVKTTGLPGLWRYAPVLPVLSQKNRIALGEGWTPLLPADRLRARLWIKDESPNPTLSFKARGMALAISKAKELGVRRVCVPTAGNAGGACAAYAARAGIEARVYMPDDAPVANRLEVEAAGGKVILVKGFISDAARRMREDMKRTPMYDVSTLKEPYRVEGKKTMGYEIVEQLGRYPDVILYPAGGGTGLIGMWKAFEEMERLGWVQGRRPRMVAVQARGCAPLVRAFEKGAEVSEEWKSPTTAAAGLRVPKAFADWLILRILRESRGAAVAVGDAALLKAVREIYAATGIFACPEGAACLPALRELSRRGWIRPRETVVLFNTGSGLKYLDVLSGNPRHANTGRR